MIAKSEAKKWGNSLGIIIPRSVVESEKIKEHDQIQFLIIKESKNVLRETFGMFKGKIKKPTQQIKDEIRADLYE